MPKLAADEKPKSGTHGIIKILPWEFIPGTRIFLNFGL